jgi:hypothetical protein
MVRVASSGRTVMAGHHAVFLCLDEFLQEFKPPTIINTTPNTHLLHIEDFILKIQIASVDMNPAILILLLIYFHNTQSM